MNHFEEYIAEWYDTIPEGGGTAASPWKIEWNDVPYKERDTRPLSRLKVLGAMKEVLFNGTPTQRAAVYIHIPFCRLSCTYCSFFKKKGDNKAQHEYVELLLKELESLSDKPYVKKSKISAVFFGGGTPGILSAGDMADILCAIKKTFLLAEDAEVTMESSLSDMTEEKMDVAIAGGVTRFSFGIQSFNSQVRNTVGRPYSREEVLKQLSIYSKKKADIIIDLIYGLPYETEETMRQDIRDAAACGIAGLDLYKLQLLPDSPLGKSFAAAGKCLIESEVQVFFQVAEEELNAIGAENISCSHWRMKQSERNLYNTIASGSDDLFAIGMACGGRIGGVSFMKPIPDAMYHSVVKMGMYCPMAAEKEGKYHAFFSALQSAGNRGNIDLSALEEMFGLPVAKLLMPLFQTWEVWGLLELIENQWRMTSPGRYWYRTMTRLILRAADYMCFGLPENTKKADWHGMINMK